MKNEKIGLALGSGAARGWAHIGVLRALAETNTKIDCVSGTSMGAMVGAIFALGRMEFLEEAALQMNWGRIVGFLDVTLPKSGLIDGKKIEAFIRQHVPNTSFEDLRIPFAAVATDLRSGSAVILKTGDVIEAVRASISIPGIFTPALQNDRILVDGGLVDPVPVKVARSLGADRVIAVDVNHALSKRTSKKAAEIDQVTRTDNRDRPLSNWFEHLRTDLNVYAGTVHPSLSKQIRIWSTNSEAPSIYEVLGNSIYIMEERITETNLQITPPDLLIRPKFDNFRFMDFHRAEEAIEAGYSATLIALEAWR